MRRVRINAVLRWGGGAVKRVGAARGRPSPFSRAAPLPGLVAWTARGSVWRDGAFVDGYVTVEDGRIAAVGRGSAPGLVHARGVIVPAPVNAHTHVGDHLARGRAPPGATLAELVEPPHGLKHRILAAASPAQLRGSIEAALAEAAASGTGALLDFREGGAAGARALREAAREAGVRAVALGRPGAGEPEDAFLAMADGVGISALRDVGAERARALAKAARAAGKRVAIHWSEGERESVEALLDLAPDFAVHAVRATRDDLARIADARVPLVACPRSNARLLGALPDVRAWIDAGIDVAIGSDNAMLQSVSVLDELAFARARMRDVTPAELVAMAVDAPRARLLPREISRGVTVGAEADLIVLAAPTGDPFDALLAPGARVLARAPRLTSGR